VPPLLHSLGRAAPAPLCPADAQHTLDVPESSCQQLPFWVANLVPFPHQPNRGCEGCPTAPEASAGPGRFCWDISHFGCPLIVKPAILQIPTVFLFELALWFGSCREPEHRSFCAAASRAQSPSLGSASSSAYLVQVFSQVLSCGAAAYDWQSKPSWYQDVAHAILLAEQAAVRDNGLAWVLAYQCSPDIVAPRSAEAGKGKTWLRRAFKFQGLPGAGTIHALAFVDITVRRPSPSMSTGSSMSGPGQS
jgi:hypothetical protein